MEGQAPVLLRPEEVSEDLICSICMTLPVEPVLTPCEHLFCKSCIHQALEGQSQCPVDRKPCNSHQIFDLTGMLYRIWSDVKVKCGKHGEGCAWTGSIADYASHAKVCTLVRGSVYHNRHFQLNQDLKQKLEEAEIEKRKFRTELEAQTQRIQELQAQLQARPKVPPLFNGTYDFKRGNVVKLSQLVSRYLESCPPEIDTNKIFNCVKNCYADLQKNYQDNPAYYRVDMRMLLTTCAASTWFTDRQRGNINQWLQEQGWF